MQASLFFFFLAAGGGGRCLSGAWTLRVVGPRLMAFAIVEFGGLQSGVRLVGNCFAEFDVYHQHGRAGSRKSLLVPWSPRP